MISFIISVDNDYILFENFWEDLTTKLDIDAYEFVIITDGDLSAELTNYLEKLDNNIFNVKVLFNKNKIGYGAANNLAVKTSAGDKLVFINTDVLLTENCIEILLDSMLRHCASAIQPLLIYPQTNKIQSCGHIFGYSFNSHLFEGRSMQFPYAKIPAKRQALTTALCIVERRAFESCHGFDEYYFNAWEGMELTLKLTHSGLSCWFEPAAVAYHIRGGGRNQYIINEKPQSAEFWKRWGGKSVPDIIDIFNMQLTEQTKKHQYLVYNFSSIREWETILTESGILFETMITKPWLSKRPLDFFSVLAYSTIQYPGRLLFLCDSFSNIINNNLWLKYRGNKGDIYIDTSGNIGLLTELY